MIKYINFIAGYVITEILHLRIKPRVIQLPITNKCNSHCITCNIWKNKVKKNIDSKILGKILRNSFFNKVHTIGINGGEPSLYNNTRELIRAVCIPSLKNIHIISNGVIDKKLLPFLILFREECLKRNIKLHVSISVDGINDLHDEIRGFSGAFNKTISTIEKINADVEKYCDDFYIGCTVSQKNVFRLSEIDSFFLNKNIPVSFHIAVPNKRLDNFIDNNFSILNNDYCRLMGIEFFYFKFKYSNSFREKIKYFIDYYYLKNNGKKRLAGCSYLKSDITIDQNLDLYLCATASDKIGNLKENTISEINNKRLLDKESIKVKKHCNECIHYVVYPSFKGFILFINECLRSSIWIKYKILSWLK